MSKPKSVLQEWVHDIPFMQQSVLISSIRAPDGIHKRHLVKVFVRWMRRSILISAFDNRAIDDPFFLGGGSFTGPFTEVHAKEMGVENEWNLAKLGDEDRWKAFFEFQKIYLDFSDELPHHFQTHFMHAAQILGQNHPTLKVREYWNSFYQKIVNSYHLRPESPQDMNQRLSDNEKRWRSREETHNPKK